MAYRDVILADSPSHYWRWGSGTLATADEVTGANARSGAPSAGASVPGLLTRDSDPAVQLNGINSAAMTPNNDAFAPPITLEAWVNLSGTNPAKHETLIGIRHFNITDAARFSIVAKRNTTGNPLSYWDGGAGTWTDSSFSLTRGQRYHVVATLATNAITFYVNNVKYGPISRAFSYPFSMTELWIGGSPWNSGERMQGIVDETAVYPYVLTAAQVAQHYLAGTNPAAAYVHGVTPLRVIADELLDGVIAPRVASGTISALTASGNPSDARAAGVIGDASAAGIAGAATAGGVVVPNVADGTLD